MKMDNNELTLEEAINKYVLANHDANATNGCAEEREIHKWNI